MPAIQPARLRLQTIRLAELFNQPAAFVRALHGLLGLYSDRTHRPGQSGTPPPLVTAYNVPRPVLHHIQRELNPIIPQDQGQTLDLCKALWAEPYFEFRVLAAYLLGRASVTPPEAIFAMLTSWLASKPEDRILGILLDEGLSRMRQEYPEKLLEIAKEWLQEASIEPKQNAIQILRPLAKESNVNHLPKIFQLITPSIRRAPTAMKPDLINLLSAAATASPQETAFVLRENLQAPDSPDTAWFIRQLMENFPPNQQEILKAALVLNRKDRSVL